MSSEQDHPPAADQPTRRQAQARPRRDQSQEIEDIEMPPAPPAQGLQPQPHRTMSASARTQSSQQATAFSSSSSSSSSSPPDRENDEQAAHSSNPPQDQDQQQPDKQPPPPPPPEPGPRATRLQALFASTARHTLDKISRDNFAACFPTVAQRAPGTLEFVQRQMVERLGGLWEKEFETILANRQVVARLNELELLVGDAARRRQEAGQGVSPPIAPHTLPATAVLAAHLAPHLAAQQSQLNARLQNTQAANAQLWSEIQAQRAEMEALLAGVEKVLLDVDGANVLLGDVADELAEETRAAERDVRAVGVGGFESR